MIIRAAFTVTAILILAGCSSPEPETSDDYFKNVNNSSSPALEAERRRLAQAEGRVDEDIIDTTTPASAINGRQSNTAELIRRDQDQQSANAEPPVPAKPEDRTTISNSQDFEAVSGRVTADSDAAKLEELKRTYKVFEPTAVPSRGSSVDLESFARANADRAIGRKRYTRRRADYKEAGNSFCADYTDQDLAQINFLNQGGPKKDPLLLDQDGDGFACNWRPDVYVRGLERRSRRAAAITGTPLN